MRGDYKNYQISGDSELYKFNIENMETMGTEENLNLNFYEITQDPVNNYLYATNTDFSSYGTLYVYDTTIKLNDDIINKLLPTDCPGLAGRPKLLFVQACRGEKTDAGTEMTFGASIERYE